MAQQRIDKLSSHLNFSRVMDRSLRANSRYGWGQHRWALGPGFPKVEGMKLRSALIAGASLALAFCFGAGAAQATTIDTMPFWDGSTNIASFGQFGAQAYGETFTAPGGPLTSYSFVLDDLGTGQLDVIGQVYAWSGNLICNPCSPQPFGATGPALFTSAEFIIPKFAGFQTVTVNTGAVSLTTGNQYVILLADIASTGGSNWGTVSPGPGVANDGGFNAQYTGLVPPDPSLINTQTWNDFGDNGSLVYTATFGSESPVPEPSTLGVVGLGLIGLCAMKRRHIGRRSLFIS
jgi:PEP-CTERM motif